MSFRHITESLSHVMPSGHVRERRRIFHWNWKLRCVALILRYPPTKAECPIVYKLRITGLFLGKEMYTRKETYTSIPRTDPLKSLNNFRNGRSFPGLGRCELGSYASLYDDRSPAKLHRKASCVTQEAFNTRLMINIVWKLVNVDDAFAYNVDHQCWWSILATHGPPHAPMLSCRGSWILCFCGRYLRMSATHLCFQIQWDVLRRSLAVSH